MGLYRPTVTKKRKDGTKYTVKSRTYWGSFRHPVTDTTVRMSLKTRDKAAAQTLLRHAERRAALEHAGLVSPFEEHEKRPLNEHVDEYERHLCNSGATKHHIETVVPRVRKVLDGCGLMFWPDLSGSRVQGFIAQLRTDGRSIQTCNFYLQAVQQFCRWMVRDGRASDSPLAHLRGNNVRVDRRHDRRAFTHDELRALLEWTRTRPTRYNMTGPERALLYGLAVETGLRAGEIRSLTTRSFSLESEPPTVTVKAAYSKHRREDVQPLRPEFAHVMAEYLHDRDADAPIFNVPEKTAKMLRADLADARSAWIDDAGTDEKERKRREKSSFLAYKDETERYIDFHALRHTFITNLARGGVHPKQAQDLARHSDINLTMSRYSHTVIADRAAALEALPDLTTGPEREQRRATGTYDTRPESLHGVCTEFVQTGVVRGHRGSPDGTVSESGEASEKPQTQPRKHTSGRSRHRTASNVTTTPHRTRTCNLRFRRPMLYPIELAAHALSYHSGSCTHKTAGGRLLVYRRGPWGQGQVSQGRAGHQGNCSLAPTVDRFRDNCTQRRWQTWDRRCHLWERPPKGGATTRKRAVAESANSFEAKWCGGQPRRRGPQTRAFPVFVCRVHRPSRHIERRETARAQARGSKHRNGKCSSGQPRAIGRARGRHGVDDGALVGPG